VARAIVHLSLDLPAGGRSYHHGHAAAISLRRFLARGQRFGYALEFVDPALWRRRLTESADAEANALFPLLALLDGDGETAPASAKFASKSTQKRYDCRKTITELRAAGIEPPPLDDRLLDTYYRYFIKTGLLPQLTAAAENG
jgi:hypothetical protein